MAGPHAPARRAFGSLFLAALAVAGPASAQQLGQWSWDLRLGYEGRAHQNSLEGMTTSRYREHALHSELGVNGYLGHPLLGTFRLGASFLSTAYSDSGVDRGRRLGYSLDVHVLPRGRYSARLSVRREHFGYSAPAGADAFVSGRLPDTGTAVDGDVWLRGGPLRNLQLGLRSSSYDFEGGGRPERYRNAFAHWERRLGKLQSSFRVERQDRDYSVADLSSTFWIARLHQLARLNGGWGWQLTANALRTRFESGGRAQPWSDELRVLQRTDREIGPRSRVDLSLQAALLRPGEGQGQEAYGAALLYRHRPRPAWEVAPFVDVKVVSADERSFTAPRAGLELSFVPRGRALGGKVTARAAWGRLLRDRDAVEPDETELSYDASASLTHGADRGFVQELEGEAGRNEIRLSEVDASPTPGLAPVPIGREDFVRGRLRLTYRWDNSSVSAWGEHGIRRFEPSAGDARLDRRATSANAQLALGPFSLAGTLGDIRTASRAGPEEHITFASALIDWRVFRAVRLDASFRSDSRRLAGLPRLDGDRLEAGIVFSAGRLDLRTRVFRTRERFADGPDRENLGILWSLRRDFSGWLPVVTGASRRGTVR